NYFPFLSVAFFLCFFTRFLLYCFILFFSSCLYFPYLHSFPTRRSSDLLVLLHEVQFPIFRMVQITEAFISKTTQEVKRKCRFIVSREQPLGIGCTCFGGRGDAVNQVAAIVVNFLAVYGLEISRARLGILSGNAANAQHGRLHLMNKDKAHLQQNLQKVHNLGRGTLRKSFGTITALKQETAPG